MANKQVISMLQKQRAKLERKVTQAEASISDWKSQMDSLDGAISALGGGGRRGRPKGTGAKGRKRGTWRVGHPGRPPQWYIDQQKAKGKKAPKPAKAKKGKRKRKASAKQLAAMAKAREALAAKRKAAAKAAS
jgi:hypothetical protein